jgi:hypothetical protein
MTDKARIRHNRLTSSMILLAGVAAVPVCLFLVLIFIGERALLGYLVPYATLAEPTLTDVVRFFFLAAIQFPIYGIMLSIAWVMSDRFKIMFLLTFGLLITKHYITAVEAIRIAHELILF